MYGAHAMQMQSCHLLPIPMPPYPTISFKYFTQSVLTFTSPKWSNGYGSNYHKCANSSFESLSANLNNSIEGLNSNTLGSL